MVSEIDNIKEIPDGNFPINLTLIQRHQRVEPSLMAKYKDGTYHKSPFRGIISNNLSLITCEDNIVIPSKLQSYVLYWYHTYLIHPGIDRTEVMIFQHLYWTGIKNDVQKEVTNYDTFQRTKRSNKKYVKLPDKLAE